MVQAVHVVAKLGVADQMGDSACSIDDLAKRVDAVPDALLRVMRGLSAIGIFKQIDARTFAQTPMSNTLRAGVPGSIKSMAVTAGEDYFWRAWGGLYETMKTNKPSFEIVHGEQFFKYISHEPDLGLLFNGWMVETAKIQSPAILKAYDFSKFRTVADIGGGHGGFLGELLRACSAVQGVLFDQPEVIKTTKLAQDNSVSSRVTFKEGDFFASIPFGLDCYILKYIMHDWDDTSCLKILNSCKAAMKPDSRLVVLDMVIPEGSAWHYGKLSDINMMVLNHGGCERTAKEFGELFRAAGLTLKQIVPTDCEISVIEVTLS